MTCKNKYFELAKVWNKNERVFPLPVFVINKNKEILLLAIIHIPIDSFHPSILAQ